MGSAGRVEKTGTAFLLVALTIFAASAGIFVRDLGAGFGESASGPVESSGEIAIRFYAYELTYELAVFSTVQVDITVEALFREWRVEFQNNGSFLTSFRPELPGVHQVTVTNTEDLEGQIGVSLLQQNPLPPELETSLLNPMLVVAALFLIASISAYFLTGIMVKRNNHDSY